jgi:putative membrane protein
VQQWVPYCGLAPLPAVWHERWNFDPLLLVALMLAALAWRLLSERPHSRRTAAYFAGLGVLVVLFVSPFCALTTALFSARAAHHVVLVAAAAPLLAWSAPSPMRAQRWPLGVLTGLHAAVLWAWHVPSLYAAALASAAIYWLMQISLLGSAVLFWTAVRHASPPAAVAALLATTVQMGLLGALVTFASAPLYPPHFLTTAPWGLTPLEDQQLAGLIMWAPAAAFYLAAGLLIAGRSLREEGRTVA